MNDDTNDDTDADYENTWLEDGETKMPVERLRSGMAVGLRVQGLSWETICRRLGYPNAELAESAAALNVLSDPRQKQPGAALERLFNSGAPVSATNEKAPENARPGALGGADE